MSRQITTVLSCGALALGGAAVAGGCGKDGSATGVGSSTATTATTKTGSRTITAPRTSTSSTGARKTSTTPARGPKPTKTAKRPKPSVLKAATLVVLIKRNAFKPARLQAKVRQSITWRNDDPRRHNVTAVEGAGFRSGDIKAGGTYTFTPRKAGQIQYVCTIHPGQRGRIDVID
jgi:plastocyanin